MEPFAVLLKLKNHYNSPFEVTQLKRSDVLTALVEATQNRHLIKNDVKFQWIVFIFLTSCFQEFFFVPIASVQHFMLSIPDYRYSNSQQFPRYSIKAPIFNLME